MRSTGLDRCSLVGGHRRDSCQPKPVDTSALKILSADACEALVAERHGGSVLDHDVVLDENESVAGDGQVGSVLHQRVAADERGVASGEVLGRADDRLGEIHQITAHEFERGSMLRPHDGPVLIAGLIDISA